MTDNSQPSSLTRRERLAYGLALGSMAVFTLLGAYLLYNPSDALASVFVVMMAITLGLGVVAGVVAVYSS